MEDRSSTSKPVNPTSQSTNSDLKSPTGGASRPLYSSKVGDQKGRASETSTPSPTTRQPPVPKAWTSAKNPITGRTNTQQTSSSSQAKVSATSSLREGQRVRISLSSGAEFEGIYANHPTDPASCSLRMVQQKKLPNSGDITNGRREQPNMSFQRKDITDARVLPGNAGKTDGKTNGNRSSFRTDTAISNSRAGGERALKPWVPDSTDEMDGSLEKSSSNNTGSWDQFAANEKLFGLKSDYDENIYTTTIDKSHPQYRERMAAAERKAREIERSTTNNSHVAEERVMDFVGGKDNEDEEDKYSGVRRGEQKQQDLPALANRENKYTPPARRAPTGAATVKGAPVDPAIISSALKSNPGQKPAVPKSEDSKSPVPSTGKAPATPTAEAKAPENKADGKAPEIKAAETKTQEAKSAEKTTTPLRPAASNSRTISPQPKDGAAAPSATSTVERDVLNSFKNFATQQRMNAEKVRSSKAKADKEIKLTELKKFADSFKLSTPVPKDLISIIAKDPAKQKQIQEKARINAEEVAKQKEAKGKDQTSPSTSSTTETKPKPSTETPTPPAAAAATATATATAAAAAAAAPADQRTPSRPAPPHGNAQTGVPNRHQGPRNSYNPQQPHYNNGSYNRGNNRQPPHLGQTQQTGSLGQRLRANQHNQKMDHQHQHQQQQHPHANQHLPPHPPTGPANNVDYGRRLSGVPPTQPHAAAHLQPKLNPNSTEFRPNAFAPSFNPGAMHPSQSSSPRSSANNVAVPHPTPTPVPGQLVRRKTKAINTKKCYILGHIQGIPAPAGRSWEDNDGLRPAFDTLPTWRQLNDTTDKPGSTMHLSYTQYFEQLPISSTALATPNPTHVVPIPHQHQLPFHMQHGGHNGPPRQSPHMPAMQMHGPQPPVPHAQFNPEDHRMVASHSSQSYASPRMGQVPMAYPPTPGQMPYSQPVMPQQYMNPGTPQMNQFRSFSNNPQFVHQHPPNMGNPIMVQPHFMPGPNGMVAGPQVPMYSGGHPAFLPPGGGPPQSMPASNGFPSPGRPVAPMMAHQGSHQGQPYGMSPGMGYQQPAYTPQQPGGKFQSQRPQ